jgi:hypothetical protein
MYFIGDTHGIRPIFNIIDRHKLENQNLIHVGDLGLGFLLIQNDVANLKLLDEMLIETNNQLYVIRGNHDNPIFWDKSKGLNLPKFHNLHLVEDFSLIKIEDKNVLFAGGAISIDRRPRMDDIPHPSWWKDEVFKYDEEKLKFLLHDERPVDIVVTHSAPDYCHPVGSDNYLVNQYAVMEKQHGLDLHAELAEERAEISRFANDLILHYGRKPTHWFYGHFHSTKKTKVGKMTYQLLNINELYEVK